MPAMLMVQGGCMERCRFVDYSDRPDCLVELHDYRCVTLDNIGDASYAVAQDRFSQVEVGDHISVYLIDNRIEGIQGVLTIWHNREIACLDRGEGKVWGDWLEDLKLVMTDDFEEVEDEDGMARIGRIAYNTHGMRGKYGGGKFYTLFRGEALADNHEIREKVPWNAPNVRQRSE
jgi:hypothetical protein